MDFRKWLDFLESTASSRFSYRDLSPQDQSSLYRVFAESYTKATGKAWDQYMFASRAANWEFYGTPPPDPNCGFVAVRPQASGLIKLVGAAGSPMACARGFRALLAQDGAKPIWGVMSGSFVPSLLKSGFIQPPPDLIAAVAREVPQLAQQIQGVDDSGGLQVQVAGGVGSATKHFVGNPPYFEWLLKSPASKMLSPDILNQIAQLIGQRYQPGMLGRFRDKVVGSVARKTLDAIKPPGDA